MSKRKIALIINVIVLALELLVFGRYLIIDHSISVEYYTVDTNLLALISSLLFIIFYKKEKSFVKDIRYVATCCLIVTFLTVVFVLCPMDHFNYKLYMFSGVFLILHTFVPILSAISYILFEEKSSKTYLSLVVTLIYGIVLVILNLLNVVQGPYQFLMVKEQSLIQTILWGIIIIGGSYLIGLLINNVDKIKKRS